MGGAVGLLLRQWRLARGKTQLDLSFDAGVSQRHISFVESGRSAPSRQMVLDLAQALDVPLRERNALLEAAGFAPVYPAASLDDPQMTAVNAALTQVLRRHEPFPAIVLDRYWNVRLANEAALRLFNCFVDLDARPRPRNLLHLMFDPAGMRPFIANFCEVKQALLARVRREAMGRVIDVETQDLLDALASYTLDGPREPPPETLLPMVPISFAKGSWTLNYFSMISTVGTPQSVTAEELRIECMYPADAATESAHGRFVEENSFVEESSRATREKPAARRARS